MLERQRTHDVVIGNVLVCVFVDQVEGPIPLLVRQVVFRIEDRDNILLFGREKLNDGVVQYVEKVFAQCGD